MRPNNANNNAFSSCLSILLFQSYSGLSGNIPQNNLQHNCSRILQPTTVSKRHC